MTAGLKFRETMSGYFSLDVQRPEDGASRGSESGQKLAMHAEVKIDDIEAFADDPDHPGELSGTIDFPPLGTQMEANGGRFNLFSPADEPDMKLMVYELSFTTGGDAYYLAGRKCVRDDPGFDLWSDTTTLYTTLHAGHSAEGEVVGAGILSLGLTDLLALLSTVEVTGAESAGEKASVVGRFGRLFLGELWGSYAARVPGYSEGADR